MDQLLTKALLNDSDETVRAEAADALGYRKLSSAMLNNYHEVLLHDKSTLVVKKILKHLSSAQDANSGAKNELIWFLKNCGHSDLCQYAAQLGRDP